jgi:hypothetical protein
LLSAHDEGWKRLQRRDAVSLIARILSRLTPIRTSADSPEATTSEGSGDKFESLTEAVGATTEAALLRSQSCNKVLNLVQALMKITGAAGLLRGNDQDSVPSSDPIPAMVTEKNGFATVNAQLTSPDQDPLFGLDDDPPPFDSVACSSVSIEGKAIMRSVTRVLMAGPRTMLWFPALLRAAEVLQLLILDSSGAEVFLATMHSERMPLAHGTLESHILLDMLHTINSTLQPQRLKPVSSLEHRPVDL